MGVSFRSDYRIENTCRVAGCSHCVRHLRQVREGRPHRSRERPAPVRASLPPLRARDVPPREPGLGRADSRRGNGKLIPGHSLTRRCSGLASLATELHSLGHSGFRPWLSGRVAHSNRLSVVVASGSSLRVTPGTTPSPSKRHDPPGAPAGCRTFPGLPTRLRDHPVRRGSRPVGAVSCHRACPAPRPIGHQHRGAP